LPGSVSLPIVQRFPHLYLPGTDCIKTRGSEQANRCFGIPLWVWMPRTICQGNACGGDDLAPVDAWPRDLWLAMGCAAIGVRKHNPSARPPASNRSVAS